MYSSSIQTNIYLRSGANESRLHNRLQITPHNFRVCAQLDASKLGCYFIYAKLNTKLLFLIFITKRKIGENQLWIFIFIFILSQEINPRLPLSSLSFFSDGKCNGMRHDTVIVFQGPFFRISLFFSTRVENRSVTTKNTTRPEIIFCQWPLNKP